LEKCGRNTYNSAPTAGTGAAVGLELGCSTDGCTVIKKVGVAICLLFLSVKVSVTQEKKKRKVTIEHKKRKYGGQPLVPQQFVKH